MRTRKERNAVSMMNARVFFTFKFAVNLPLLFAFFFRPCRLEIDVDKFEFMMDRLEKQNLHHVVRTAYETVFSTASGLRFGEAESS